MKLPALLRGVQALRQNQKHVNSCPGSLWYLLVHAAQLRSGQRINFGDIHQGLDQNLFALLIARAARRTVVHSFSSVAGENARVGAPGDDFTLRLLAHDVFMIRIDRFDHFVIFTNASTRHGNIRFKFKTPVGMFLFQIEEDLLNVAASFAYWNGWGNANIEKQFGVFGRAARSTASTAATTAPSTRTAPATSGRSRPDSMRRNDSLQRQAPRRSLAVIRVWGSRP